MRSICRQKGDCIVVPKVVQRLVDSIEQPGRVVFTGQRFGKSWAMQIAMAKRVNEPERRATQRLPLSVPAHFEP